MTIYRAPEGDDGGGGGTTDTDTTTDTTTTDTTTEGGGTAGPLDLAARLAAAESMIASLSSEKESAEAAAEAARVAAMTETERLAAEREAFTAEIAEGKASIRKEARAQALDKLGVLPAYRDFVPDVDPRTAEGAAVLEKWATDRPEVVKKTAAAAPGWTPPKKGILERIVSGEVVNPLVPPDSVRKLGGSN